MARAVAGGSSRHSASAQPLESDDLVAGDEQCRQQRAGSGPERERVPSAPVISTPPSMRSSTRQVSLASVGGATGHRRMTDGSPTDGGGGR